MTRFAPLAALLLAACSLDLAGSTSSAAKPVVDVSSTSDDGSGYSLPMASRDDMLRAVAFAKPCEGCLENIEARVTGFSDGVCPAISGEPGYLLVEGGCTTEGGVEFVGRMTVRDDAGARVVAFEGFEVHDRVNGFEFLGDGSFLSDSAHTAYNLTYTWHDGSTDDGTFAYDLDVVRAGDTETISGEVMVESGIVTGSFAVETSLTQVASCEIEPVGSITVIGAEEATLHLDGAKSCDNCGELAIGDEKAENVCR